MALDPQKVSEKFLAVVNARSGGGILGLARNFKIIDKDGSQSLNFGEFKIAMTKFRVGLTADEMKCLFNHYDKDGSGSLDFDEFLKGLRSQLSPQRRELTEQAFVAMDTDGSGMLDYNDLKDKYNTDHHPKVIAKEWTHEQAVNEFLQVFEGDEGNKDGQVSIEEWMDYHAGLSASIDTDDAFGIMMAHNWGIEYVPKRELEEIIKIMKQKCEAKSGNKSAKNVAKDIFKFFDTDNTKTIDYAEFTKAMEQFGNLSDKQLKTFFGMFDGDNSGTIEYGELVDIIFRDHK